MDSQSIFVLLANGKNVTERSKFQGIEWKKIQQNPEEFDKVNTLVST